MKILSLNRSLRGGTKPDNSVSMLLWMQDDGETKKPPLIVYDLKFHNARYLVSGKEMHDKGNALSSGDFLNIL
jgi:hypothetical protein